MGLVYFIYFLFLEHKSLFSSMLLLLHFSLQCNMLKFEGEVSELLRLKTKNAHLRYDQNLRLPEET